MRNILTIDLKDYDLSWKKFYRPSVRGIIFDQNGNVAMIYSQKYHFYKFPGGGIEGDETHIETLAREIKEETGMTVIPSSVNEFGEVLRIQKYDKNDRDLIFVQQNFYYTCKVENEIEEQNLDEGEKEAEFILAFVPIEQAIRTNDSFESSDMLKKQMVEREKRVLEVIKSEQ